MAKTKYMNTKELSTAIDKYFAYIEDNNIHPTWANMLLYLNISDSTMSRYLENKDRKYPGYAEPIKRAQLRLCDYWQRLALERPNLQTFCMFELKQVHNGGFRDKPKDDPTHSVSLDIHIGGCDGFDPGA